MTGKKFERLQRLMEADLSGMDLLETGNGPRRPRAQSHSDLLIEFGNEESRAHVGVDNCETSQTTSFCGPRDWGKTDCDSGRRLDASVQRETLTGGRAVGQRASDTESFCPIQAINKYPYKYAHVEESITKEISGQFFASGRFWKHHWSV